MLPLIAWLHKDALIAQLDAEIATEADDDAALTHEVRSQRQAEVLGDLLSTERDESFFIRRGQREGLPVEHRSDCSPEGILQVASIVAPRVTASGSSREHAIDVVHHSGQRRQ